jgi:hypothetical protein
MVQSKVITPRDWPGSPRLSHSFWQQNRGTSYLTQPKGLQDFKKQSSSLPRGLLPEVCVGLSLPSTFRQLLKLNHQTERFVYSIIRWKTLGFILVQLNQIGAITETVSVLTLGTTLEEVS